MADAIVETVLWKPLQWAGHEAARLQSLDGGWQLDGAAAFLEDGVPCRLVYTIRCHEDWTTRDTRVQGWLGERELDLTIAHANGMWTMNGVEQPQVAGCTDIDLNFSPSTNLLPIRRLALAVGQSGGMSAAWLRFPGFELEALDQRYTRLAADRVRFEAFRIDFTAELRVSANGMVLDYGDLWSVER